MNIQSAKTPSRTLSELPKGMLAKVVDVGGEQNTASHHLIRRLNELGFLCGETVKVLRRVAGGEPIAVRVGCSTFALRRHEAECIRVELISA